MVSRKEMQWGAYHKELEEEIRRVQKQFNCKKIEATAIVADKAKRARDYNLWGAMKLKRLRGL